MFKTCLLHIEQKDKTKADRIDMDYCAYPTNMASCFLNIVMFTRVARMY